MAGGDTENTSVDLTGLTIPDITGTTRRKLRGSPDSQKLADTLIREWVPAMRCVKCGRSDYCKYVYQLDGIRHPVEHVECGACAQALRLFVKSFFLPMAGAPASEKQLYLDAAFHFTRFVYAAETRIGALCKEDMVDYWGTAGPILYRMLFPLRDMLDDLIRAFKDLPGFEFRPGIVLVEGEAERALISEIFTDVLVDVYEGRGNRRPKRIAMLLQRYRQDGYRVSIQGDADGGNTAQAFEQLVGQGLVEPEGTFIFEHDLESSFPSDLLLSALHDTGLLQDIELEEFISHARDWQGSIHAVLEHRFGISIHDKKVKLASAVARSLEARNWRHDRQFMDSELGRFMTFVSHAR